MVAKNSEVAVVLLTYNQEKFIKYSIESVLNQRFVKSFKLYVFDDNSSDSTFEIAKEFKRKFPDKVTLIKNTKNLGLAKNFEKAILYVKENYIAYLEGDDYWTDNFKLQKQFDFLEQNPRFILAYHDFVTIDAENHIISFKNLSNLSIQKNRTQKDMVKGCLIHQNTMMFRNIVRKFPKGFFWSKNHDTFFIAYLSKWGEAAYISCSPLHYRVHIDSIWSSLLEKEKHWNGLLTYINILFYVSPRYYGSVLWKIGSKIKLLILS
jgi:glycosyltransferase involved in cell wall biosynthesis